MKDGRQVSFRDKFIATRDLHATGLTSWGAPYTGSFGCVIPKGTVLIALSEQVSEATGFGVIPERYKELESMLVPESDRAHKKYGGYYFVFSVDDIGDKLLRVRYGKRILAAIILTIAFALVMVCLALYLIVAKSLIIGSVIIVAVLVLISIFADIIFPHYIRAYNLKQIGEKERMPI